MAAAGRSRSYSRRARPVRRPHSSRSCPVTGAPQDRPSQGHAGCGLADRACSSRAIRHHLRRCRIRAAIPQPAAQAVHRKRLGLPGGRARPGHPLRRDRRPLPRWTPPCRPLHQVGEVVRRAPPSAVTDEVHRAAMPGPAPRRVVGPGTYVRNGLRSSAFRCTTPDAATRQTFPVPTSATPGPSWPFRRWSRPSPTLPTSWLLAAGCARALWGRSPRSQTSPPAGLPRPPRLRRLDALREAVSRPPPIDEGLGGLRGRRGAYAPAGGTLRRSGKGRVFRATSAVRIRPCQGGPTA